MISAEPLPGGADLARLGRDNIGTLRLNLACAYVQAAADVPYDWSHCEGGVGNAARNGIRVLATVYSSPGWAEPAPEYPPLGPELFPFAGFVRAAAQRYGAAGSFWRDHPELPKLPITEWQLWNEPNSVLFWKPAPDAHACLTLLRVFRPVLRRADPGAKVMLGGLFPTPRGGQRMEDFITRLYAAGGGELLDAVALHAYSSTPEVAFRRVDQLRTLMRRVGKPATPIWITDIGWASGRAPSGLTVDPERQADYLRRTFELALAERRRPGIAGVIWYDLRDSPSLEWPGHSGLFELDGSPKPSWEAFAKLAGGTAR